MLSLHVYVIFLQAKKRKLGLLDDDDVSKLADAASMKEHKFAEEGVNDGSTSFVKQRGM